MSPPTHPTITPTSIEDLPPEMINELFKHLPPKDLVNCSMVNKRWYSIYATFKLYRLVAIADPVDIYIWYNEEQTILEIEWCKAELFRWLAEKSLLSNLRHLALAGPFEFDLNKLNRFRQLVHLEIQTDCMHRKAHLNLPRLRVLAFDVLIYYGILSIDCPLLSELLYRSEDGRLQVKQPETIRKLETDVIGSNLVPFKGVECLVTKELGAISKTTLLLLPALKELHYNEDIELLFAEESHNGPGAVDRLKQTLSAFLDEAKKLRGSDFHFRSSGFQLTNVNMDQIDFGVQVDERSGKERVYNEYVYMKNYHLIEPGALFVYRVNYTRLLSHVTGEFPRCFSRKFTGIWRVDAKTEVPDAHHFLWFLKSLRSLRRLALKRTELGQEFYDQLPASAHSLVDLFLLDGHCKNGLQMNFDFIAKLPRLFELNIRPCLPLESLALLVRRFGKLEMCTFNVRSKGQGFWIKKNSTSWSILNRFQNSIFETESPVEIVNFFQRLQDTPEDNLEDNPEDNEASDGFYSLPFVSSSTL